MIDNWVRAALPKYVQKLIGVYRQLGLSPNHITLASFLVAAIAAVAVAFDHPFLAIALWWISRIFDGTDGILARETDTATSFGAYLDIVCDMAAYSVMILGFIILHPPLLHLWVTVLFLYVLCITSALSLGSLEFGKTGTNTDDRALHFGAGLAEAGETGIAYSLFLLFPSAVPILLWLWISVLTFTVIVRTILAKRTLS